MIENIFLTIFTILSILGVLILLERMGLFKPKCDFCNDMWRLDEELQEYGKTFNGEPRMYCTHCIGYWEADGSHDERHIEGLRQTVERKRNEPTT